MKPCLKCTGNLQERLLLVAEGRVSAGYRVCIGLKLAEDFPHSLGLVRL